MMLKRQQTVTLATPDDGSVEVEIVATWTRERNPREKDAARYEGEDDGWTAEAVSLP